jgi:hypothetical protein
VAIDGSWRLLSHNLLPVPTGVRVRVRFGDPIGRDTAPASALLVRARDEIEQTLARWRRTPV